MARAPDQAEMFPFVVVTRVECGTGGESGSEKIENREVLRCFLQSRNDKHVKFPTGHVKVWVNIISVQVQVERTKK